MDLFLQYRLGDISFDEFHRRTIQNEFERILEEPSLNLKNYCFNRRSIHDTGKSTHLNIGVSCLDIDNTGQVLLGGGDDGSLSVWGLDESSHQNDEGQQELINKRLNFIKRQPHQNDSEHTQTPYHEDKKQRLHDSNATRLVHSFQTQRNKYRMYRQSTATDSGSRSHMTSANNGCAGVRNTSLSETDAEDVISHHRYGITTLKWYRTDNGMFFTGSNDKTVKLWDTNRFEAVQNINLGYKINQIDNNIADSSSLLVVASEDYYPRLIDLRTMNSGITTLGMGNKTRMQSEILCCKFNPVREQIIACGDMQGGIKLWDLRMRNKLYLQLKRNKKGLDIIGNNNDSGDDVYFSSNESNAHLKCCCDIVWNNEGSELCSTGADGKLIIWRPFTEILRKDDITSYKQLGPQDLNRIKYKKRLSQRLLWFDKFLLCITDNGEIQIYNTEEGKLWNKLEYPMGHNQVKRSLASHCQFSSMALQTNMMNSVGLRLFLGTNSNTVSDGGSIFECS
ncbi:Rad28p [Saccharomyces eubayanus]|uniref:Rad28p n=1 Tax=Saccharomyces eubayanus TaxID=1080349 RepID=UPI0006C011D7|nr:RAD28-like protein [Saccharomyces eubayanus]KOH00887.1 RAD28-like protein [Saccharomyces eubayanus]